MQTEAAWGSNCPNTEGHEIPRLPFMQRSWIRNGSRQRSSGKWSKIHGTRKSYGDDGGDDDDVHDRDYKLWFRFLSEHAVSANCAAYGSQGLETYGDDPIGCPWTSMMDTPEIWRLNRTPNNWYFKLTVNATWGIDIGDMGFAIPY